MTIVPVDSGIITHNDADEPYQLQPATEGVAAGSWFIVQLTHNPDATNDTPTYSAVPANAIPLIAPSAASDGFCGSSVWMIYHHGGTPTWTWTPDAGYEFAGGGAGSLQWAAYSGVDALNPLASLPGLKDFEDTVNLIAHTAPSIDVLTDDAFIVGGFNTTSGSIGITPPDGWIEQQNSTIRDGWLGYKGIQETAGASGDATWTRASGAARGQAWQVALRPAVDDVIETFDDRTAADLGPDLTWIEHNPGYGTTDNVALMTSNGIEAVYRVDHDFGVDQSIAVRTSSIIPSGGYSDIGICARIDPAGGAAPARYVLKRGFGGGAGFWELRRYNGGGGLDITYLVQNELLALATGELIRLEVEDVEGGVELRIYINEALIDTVLDDSVGALTTGNYAGLDGFRSNLNANTRYWIDGFAGHSLGSDSVVLTPDNALHSQEADEVAISQAHDLSADSATHDQIVDGVSVTTADSLAVNDASHGQTADEVTLSQAHELSVNDATHAQSATSPSVTSIDDSSVTRFDGVSLPPGWTAVAPSGTSVDIGNGYCQLGIDANEDINSISNTVTAPEGPYIWHAVSGSWDYAVALAEESINLRNQGLDLLGLNSETIQAVRFACYTTDHTGAYRSDRNFFAYHRWGTTNDSETRASVPTTDTLGTELYGGPGWLRLAYDEPSSTYTASASMDGRNWGIIAQWESLTPVDRFAIHATQTPDADVERFQRIAAVVDMTGRGDDATTPPPDIIRVTLYSSNFSDGTLPPWLTPVTANGGSIDTDVGVVELNTDESQVGSLAWLLSPDDLPRDHGLLIRYQVTQTGYPNVFWVPTIRIEDTTDLPGARTPDDKYGDGTSLLMELAGRVNATAGEIIRLLRRSPIDSDAVQTGNREFDGYTMLIENLEGEVTTVDQPITWVRLEAVGDTVRSRLWYDGDPEPTTWQYEAEDHMRRGQQAAITMSHNDTVSGSGSAQVSLSQVEIYELTENLPVDDAAHAQTVDEVVLSQEHQLTTASTDHVQTADEVVLSQTHVLAVDSATHAQGADGVDLAQTFILAVDSALHDQTADEVAIGQDHNLVPNDALHTQTADVVTLSTTGTIGINSALHTQTADEVVITQAHQLVVDSALHDQTVDDVELTSTHAIAVNDTAHDQTVDSPVLSQAHHLVVDDTLHGQIVDSVTVAQEGTLVVNGASHSQTVDEVVLSQHVNIVVDDTVHVQSVDSVTIDVSDSIIPDGTIHLQTADSVVLTQSHIIIVNDAHHDQLAGTVVIDDGTFDMALHDAPCSSWEPTWCVDLDTLDPAVVEKLDMALEVATDLLWTLSGRRFGTCSYTIRPCAEDCMGRIPRGYSPIAPSMTWSWPFPTLVGGVWMNLACGVCGDSCSCSRVEQFQLPYPVALIEEVKIDGEVLDPSKYRLDEHRYLVRLDGHPWPRCNDLRLSDQHVGTWSVTATYGTAVPPSGMFAVGELALEIAKACTPGQACKLTVNTQQITRQGVTKVFLDPNSIKKSGMLGLYWVDQFISSKNPHRVNSRATIYDIDGRRGRVVGT